MRTFSRIEEKPRICFIVSEPTTASVFLNSHIDSLVVEFDIDVISNVSGRPHNISKNAEVLHVPIVRKIQLVSDLRALYLLRRTLKSRRYSLLMSVSPKAGLLVAAATLGLGIRSRIHWFTGQVWFNKSGFMRHLLKFADKFVVWRSTLVLVDSPSQRLFLMEDGVIDAAKSMVLGDGSICGVNVERFQMSLRHREEIRKGFDIPDDSCVILFVGRFTRDKGLLDLAHAVGILRQTPSTVLLLVGPDEEALSKQIREVCNDNGSDLIIAGATSQPEAFLSAGDIFCCPSYREGFGQSVTEASAVGLPCVGTNIYGLTDAILDGVSGTLVEKGNISQLALALQALVDDPQMRMAMGQSARDHVLKNFNQVRISSLLKTLLLSQTS